MLEKGYKVITEEKGLPDDGFAGLKKRERAMFTWRKESHLSIGLNDVVNPYEICLLYKIWDGDPQSNQKGYFVDRVFQYRSTHYKGEKIS